jgi:hypothetical protein
VPGAGTPDGILTRVKGTPVGRLLDEIEARPEPAIVDLGLMLMELSEKTVEQINSGITRALELTGIDFGLHDFTVGIGTTGLTIHCSYALEAEAITRLHAHCMKRKYMQKADSWFGLALTPGGAIGFLAKLKFPWTFDQAVEDAIAKVTAKTGARPARAKVGRNDPCPCGSGKKFKKCCIDRY